MYKLSMDLKHDRPILIIKFNDNEDDADQYCFNCIAFTSHMSQKTRSKIDRMMSRKSNPSISFQLCGLRDS